MLTVLVVAGIFAFVGHLMFWVNAFNKIHATALPYRVVKLYEKTVYLILLAVPIYAAWDIANTDFFGLTLESFWAHHRLVAVYCGACFVTLAFGIPAWLRQRLARPPACLAADVTTIVPVRDEKGLAPIGTTAGRLFAAIPGNEIFQLHVQEKTLVLLGLSAKLDGLSIAHLSDLHFTGDIERSFFDFIVERANEMQTDLTVVTGDIVDNAECIPWIRSSLGKLRAKYGVFCILGNHDKRIGDVQRLRDEIAAAGMRDLGGKVETLQINTETILLGGNELPWFPPAPHWPTSSVGGAAPKHFRLLLSHSPDQIEWARQHDVDLVLAGHTHGGQIRLPIIGPIIAPSRYGVRYASGVFQVGETIMHVSRGLSGLDPIRWNCPPELAKLVLRSEL